jgi:hypothetical protein
MKAYNSNIFESLNLSVDKEINLRQDRIANESESRRFFTLFRMAKYSLFSDRTINVLHI